MTHRALNTWQLEQKAAAARRLIASIHAEDDVLPQHAQGQVSNIRMLLDQLLAVLRYERRLRRIRRRPSLARAELQDPSP